MVIRNIPGVFMNEYDLAELYTYLELFRKVYGGCDSEAAAVMDAVLRVYTEEYRPADAEQALRALRNPRFAGRRPSFTADDRLRILSLRRSGMSIRKISLETGIPKSSVQRILASKKHSE